MTDRIGPQFRPQRPDTTSPWYRIEAVGLTPEQKKTVIDLIRNQGEVYLAYTESKPSLEARDVILFTSQEKRDAFEQILARTFSPVEEEGRRSPESGAFSEEDITPDPVIIPVVPEGDEEETASSTWADLSHGIGKVDRLPALFNRVFGWLNQASQERDMQTHWVGVVRGLQEIGIPLLSAQCKALLERETLVVPSREEMIALLDLVIKGSGHYPEVASELNKITLTHARMKADLQPVQQALLSLPEQQKQLKSAEELELSYRSILQGIAKYHSTAPLDKEQWHVVQARVNALVAGSTRKEDQELKKSVEEGLKDHRSRVKALGLFVSQFLIGRQDLMLSSDEVTQAKEIVIEHYPEKTLGLDLKTPTLKKMDELAKQQREAPQGRMQAAFVALEQQVQDRKEQCTRVLSKALQQVFHGGRYQDENKRVYENTPQLVGADLKRHWEEAITYRDKGKVLLDKKKWDERDPRLQEKQEELLDEVDQLCSNPLDKLAMATLTQASQTECTPVSRFLGVGLSFEGMPGKTKTLLASQCSTEKTGKDTLRVEGTVVSQIEGIKIEEKYSYLVQLEGDGQVQVSDLNIQGRLLPPITEKDTTLINKMADAVQRQVVPMHLQSITPQ